jgi:hypothetical protein
MKNLNSVLHIISVITLLVTISSCDDFVKIDPPRTALTRSTVFESDATAEAAILDIYVQLRGAGSFAGGSLGSISFLMSLLSDEQINYITGSPISVAENQQFNDNALLANNSKVLSLWSDLYKCIYKANAIIEGLESSNSISTTVRQQLDGEAKFIRAFCNFYLVNIWGDVPLVLSTDYRVNSNISRTPVATVYQHIINDLTSAQNQLKADYTTSGNQRVRANKWAATALLARVYLYVQDWPKAEEQASSIIANTGLFNLVSPLSGVFNLNSAEAILQWWNNLRPNEYTIFRFNFSCVIQPEFVNAFEANDLRRSTWVGLFSSSFVTLKYSASASNPPTQYATVLRVAEQFLIRAESRVHQNNYAGARSDINTIRTRAGLPNTQVDDHVALLEIIEQERRSEFFNEWGHRWFDLNRTNRTQQVLQSIKPQWLPTAVLFPIPESEIIKNNGLKNSQNPGY